MIGQISINLRSDWSLSGAGHRVADLGVDLLLQVTRAVPGLAALTGALAIAAEQRRAGGAGAPA